MGEIQRGEGDRKGKGGEGRGGGADRTEHGGERRRRKGKGQLSLSSTLSCFMCPVCRSATCPALQSDKERINTKISGFTQVGLSGRSRIQMNLYLKNVFM